MGDIIVAHASARGRGALAVVRISGEGSHELVARCVSQGDKFRALETRTLGLFLLIDPIDSTTVDQVVIAKYSSPKSYTSEDLVEISCHGGLAVVEKVLSVLVEAGARPAKAGEFTRRAYVHGKLDLIEAEAIKELAECESEGSRRAALKGLLGGRKQELWNRF